MLKSMDMNNFDPILEEDIASIIESDTPIDHLKYKTVLVTGATGFIGSLLVKAMIAANNEYNTNIRILAQVRNENKARQIFENAVLDGSIELIKGEITQRLDINGSLDYIIHTANVTQSKYMVEFPVDTIETSLEGTKAILELAREKDVEGFLFVSSMEIYGSFAEDGIVDEKMYGYIDTLETRSNYPLCKRMCENMCIAYMKQYGIPVKIARPAQIFGAGVSLEDNRVFAQFAKSIIEKKPIVLRTEGNSETNSCYSSDAVRGLFYVLVNGVTGEAYNIVNEQSHSTIRKMAEMCREISGGTVSIEFDLGGEFGYARDVKLRLSSEKLRTLGWYPRIGPREAYVRLIKSLEYRMGLREDTGDR